MKSKLKYYISAFVLGISGAAYSADITGAGATFPYPVYAKWAETYKSRLA